VNQGAAVRRQPMERFPLAATRCSTRLQRLRVMYHIAYLYVAETVRASAE